MNQPPDADPIEDIYPLTPIQQGMLFYTLSAPASGVYMLQTSYTLRGAMDVSAFRRAWERVVERHAILRTAFVWEGVAEPVQVVFRHVELPFDLHDWRHLPLDAQQTQLDALLEVDRVRGFDLAGAPLVRLILVRLADDRHCFIWSRHHLLVDGWSIALVLQEFFALYEAFCRGQDLHPERPRPFREYVVWLKQQDLAKAERHWRDLLRGFTAPTILQIDRAPGSVFTGEGSLAEQSLRLAPATMSMLESWARQYQLTLNTLIQGMWGLLLSRYSGEEDVIFGMTVFGRPPALPGVGSMVGLFVNALPVRVRARPHQAVLPWLKALQVQEAAAREYEYSPLMQIQAWSEVPRGRTLFDTAVAFENYPIDATLAQHSRTLQMEDVRAYDRTNYALTLFILPGPELTLRITYNNARFDADAVARMLDCLKTLLENALLDPNRHLVDLPLLSEAERRRLLIDWNDTRVDFSGQACLHRLVEAQAARTPEAIAVVFDDQHLTYRELNRRANRLARRLRAGGIRPNALAALGIERSLEMVLGALATLKAGGAYVPIDPAYPRERLAFMLEDAHAPVLLTQAHLQDLIALQDRSGLQSIRLDADWETVAQANGDDLDVDVSLDDPAYTIYTSGSTGKPKGVMISHRAIVNHMLWLQAEFNWGSADSVLQKTPFSFDASVWEMYAPLLTGGRLIVALPEGHRDAAYMARTINEQHVTVLQMVPSLLRAMVEEPAFDTCLSLTHVFCGGETLSTELTERFRTRLPQAKLFNFYGPTEATINASYWPCRPGVEQPNVPIGRPFANIRLYVLDPISLAPAPIGLPGELYIGGACVARGYLNRPELTAERFVPAPPFPPPSETGGDAEGGRLYRTGDLVRYLPNGDLEYIGRFDQQVKVRGYRIELGEIEAALGRHPAVHEAIVAAPSTDGHRRLVAYVALNAPVESGPDASAALDLESEQVAQWQTVFETGDRASSAPPLDGDPTFNIAGWNSSYTGEPLSAEEMREWVDRTAERILTLKPRRVLEIGCGSGLLLFRIAPQCERYWGTDFSERSLAYVRSHLDARLSTKVRLLNRTADNFDGLEAGAFDLVVLNSVAQYFPSLDYLMLVLERAAQVVAPGGHIFIGDVRNLPLLEAFHTSVELSRALDDMPVETLRQRTRRAAQQESELVIDPAFFAALRARIPRIGATQVQMKRGIHLNEMTRFRYDAALRVGEAISTAPGPSRRLDWEADGLTLEHLQQLLAETRPDRLVVTGVPNARIWLEAEALKRLRRADGPSSVGELRADIQSLDRGRAIDPEAMWELGEALSYAVKVNWSAGSGDGHYDAIFQRDGSIAFDSDEALPLEGELDWRAYANHPLREKMGRRLVPELRSYLKERLPEFMQPAAIMVLDALPLTPNGKLDRDALPEPEWISPEAEENFVAPRTRIEQTLAEIWQQVLGVGQVGLHDNFFELGGDSILSIQVVSRAGQAGLRLTPKQVFQHPTLADLAAVVDTTSAASAEPDIVGGDVPLTPIQHWFFEQELTDAHHWNQSVLLAARAGLKPAALDAAVSGIVRHHDALRLRFERSVSGWRQWNAAEESNRVFGCVDLSELKTDEQSRAVEMESAHAQASLNLTSGPLTRVVYFEMSEGGRLLWVIHHLAVDGVSWRILLEDLATSYAQASRGEAIELGAKTGSYRRWAEKAWEYGRSESVGEEANYWLKLAEERIGRLPVDKAIDAELNVEGSASVVVRSLDAEVTRALLQEAGRAYRMRVDEVLLAALVEVLAEWGGVERWQVAMEGHGREEELVGVRVARTVGWFTIEYPVALERRRGAGPGGVLKAVKESMRSVPGGGLGYGLLRYRQDGVADRLRASPQAEISFNYLGQFDQVLSSNWGLTLAPESAGPTRGPCAKRRYLLGVSGSVTGGRLHIGWTYNIHAHARETIECMADRYLEALRALSAHCLSPEAGGYTPSDFPQAGLNQQELDDLVAELDDLEA